MKSHIGIRIGSLYLALPGYEVAQINLTTDMTLQHGIACVTFQNRQVPVINIDEKFQTVRSGDGLSDSQYVITLACADDTLEFKPRLALQVNTVFKLDIKSRGHIPQNMKKAQSPIIGWFEDLTEHRGFLTNTNAIENFINHTARLNTNEQHHTLAG
jgi:hypothetical protein